MIAQKIIPVCEKCEIMNSYNEIGMNATVFKYFEAVIGTNTEFEIEKIVYLKAWNKEQKADVDEAKSALCSYTNFEQVLDESKASWNELWKEIDIELTGDRFLKNY